MKICSTFSVSSKKCTSAPNNFYDFFELYLHVILVVREVMQELVLDFLTLMGKSP